jgi:hypothetical protein
LKTPGAYATIPTRASRAFAFRPWGALVRICIHKKVIHATKSSRHNLFVHTYQIWLALTRARHKSVKMPARPSKAHFASIPGGGSHSCFHRVFRLHSSRRTGFFASGEWAQQINSCECGQKRLLAHCKIAQQICTITAR